MEALSRWNEIWSAILAIVWGIVLIAPGDLFFAVERYRWLGKFFPDWMWGILFLIGGVGIIIIRSYRVRKHFHSLMFTLWVGIVVLSFLTPLNIGTVLISSLCFFVAMVHVSKYFRLSLLEQLDRHEDSEV